MSEITQREKVLARSRAADQAAADMVNAGEDVISDDVVDDLDTSDEESPESYAESTIE